jgi:hypothetical protein
LARILRRRILAARIPICRQSRYRDLTPSQATSEA